MPPAVVRLKLRIGRLYRPWRERLQAVFDRRIETAATVGSDELGFVDGRRNQYRVSGWFYLRRGLKGYVVGGDDVFVDFGSGKGRVVYQAARLPFRRVVGIELAEDLNQIARQNIEQNRGRLRCQDVELITADVTTCPVPDDMTVAYAFNPVRGELFQRLIENIVASLDRHPRRIRFIYANPRDAAEVTRSGRFKLVGRSWGIRRDLDPSIHVYESIGP